MKVLFVNHTANVSGAERSLLELLAELQGQQAMVELACPAGELMRRARELGVQTLEITPPQIGFASDPRAVWRAIIGSFRVGLELRRIAQRSRFDAIHAASTRSGLLLGFCSFLPARRFVHVRDVLPGGRRATIVRWVLRLSADVLVFNSHFTADRFGPTRPAQRAVEYPHVDIQRFLALPLPAPGDKANPVLGIVGQITPWKAQDDAIRILAETRLRHPATTLHIVGSVVFSGDSVGFDNQRFRDSLPRLAAELGVADAVEFTDETEEIESVLRSVDVLLVPSWEEPFGRVVLEGMASGVPVIATNAGGPREIITDGITGYLLAPRNPSIWAATVNTILEDPEQRLELGRAGRAIAIKLAERNTSSNQGNA